MALKIHFDIKEIIILIQYLKQIIGLKKQPPIKQILKEF
jgi:hypothetical protein